MPQQLKQFSFALSSALILSALSPAARAGSGTPLWTNFYSGVPYAVAVDGQGNAVATGVSADRGGTPVFATVKYSGTGVPLWTNLYPFAAGCDFGAYFPAMAVDNSGNVFVAGASCNLCPDLPTPTYGCLAYATLAYSNSGVPLWTNFYGPANVYNAPQAVAVDRSGNVFVTGTSLSTPYGPVYEYATVAYSGAGAPLWTNRYGELGFQVNEPVAVVVDGSGNVFVTGTSDIDIGYTTVAYSNSGVPLWTNLFSEAYINSYLLAAAMAVDASGNVFVTGTESTFYNTSYATVAYSNSGVPLWTNLYHGTEDFFDNASSVAADNNGHVFVTGKASVLSAETGYDEYYATLAYSSAGVLLWTNRYPTAPFIEPTVPAIAVDTGGNVFLTGDSLDRNGNRGYATIAYSGAGVPFWTNFAAGVYNAYGTQHPLAVDSSGNVFVTGSSDYGYATIKYSSSLLAAVIHVSPLASLPGAANLIVIAANNATACVRLDGSSSSTPDNGSLTYQWFNEPDSLPFATRSK